MIEWSEKLPTISSRGVHSSGKISSYETSTLINSNKQTWLIAGTLQENSAADGLAQAQMSLGKGAWQPHQTVQIIRMDLGGGLALNQNVQDILIEDIIPVDTYSSSIIPDPRIPSAPQVVTTVTAARSGKKILMPKKPAFSERNLFSTWGDIPFNSSVDEDQELDFVPYENELTFKSDDDELTVGGEWNENNSWQDLNCSSVQSPPCVQNTDHMLLVDPKLIEGESLDQDIEENSIEVKMEDNEPSIDLLQFVLDDTFPLDDEAFNNIIGEGLVIPVDEQEVEYSTLNLNDIGGQVSPSLSDLELILPEADQLKQDTVEPPATPLVEDQNQELDQPQKRPRGRPRVPRTSQDQKIPQNRRGRPLSSTSSTTLSTASEDVSDTDKYRRMRDLNNEASRRCRENRKRKLVTLEQEEEIEKERNGDLQMKVRLLEEQVSRIKEAILRSFVPVSNIQLDIDEIIRQKSNELL